MSTRRQRLTRTVAAALAATALAAPAADARPWEEAFTGQDQGSGPAIEPHTEAPAPTVSRTIDDGFDLGSAAIGAGGAAAVLLLTAAGASAVTHRHHRVGVVR